MNARVQFETGEAVAGHFHAADAVSLRLISDLQRVVAVLETDIAAEENRHRKYDPSELDYPLTAKQWMERCRNLRSTIASIERYRSPAQAPDVRAAG